VSLTDVLMEGEMLVTLFSCLIVGIALGVVHFMHLYDYGPLHLPLLALCD